MPARVRDFLYLDPALVAQTLAQLEFGLFKDWEATLESANTKDGGLNLSLWGVGLKGSLGKSVSEGSRVVLEQTAESYVSRLLLLLEDRKELASIAADVDALRRGTVVSAEGRLMQLEPLTDRLSDDEWFADEGWDPAVRLALANTIEPREDGITPPRPGVIAVEDSVVVAPWRVALRVGADELKQLASNSDLEVVGVVRHLFRSAHNPSALIAIVRPIALF